MPESVGDHGSSFFDLNTEKLDRAHGRAGIAGAEVLQRDRKLIGQPCVVGQDTCCSVGSDPALLCSDFVCVPVTDPTSQP